jgi:hypothetical protein
MAVVLDSWNGWSEGRVMGEDEKCEATCERDVREMKLSVGSEEERKLFSLSTRFFR